MQLSAPPEIFKAYDVRGLYGEQIDGDVAYAVGRAFIRLLGGAPFFATYGDGVADIDLAALSAAHAAAGATVTMTVVRPELPFGVALLGDGDRVAGFREKPRADHWINGGFFVFEPDALLHLSESAVLERAPLEQLAAAGRLSAFRHDGFWACMDTYKDAVALDDLWASGDAPWAAAGSRVGS